MTTLEAFHQSDAPVYGFNGGSMKMHLTGAQTGGAFCMIESAMPAGAMTPRHVHDDEDEAFLVLEGALDITVSGKTMTIRKGESAFAPRGIPHQLHNRSGQTVRCFVISTPAGFGDFVMAAGTPAQNGDVSSAPPDPAKFAAIAARFGIRFLA